MKKADGTKQTDMLNFKNSLFNADETVKNEEYISYFKKQIEVINPNVIICCGTFDILKKIFNDKIKNIEGVKRGHILMYDKSYESAIIIDYYHPSWPNSSEILYYGLTGIYQQILKSKRF